MRIILSTPTELSLGWVRELSLESERLTATMVDPKAILVLKKGEFGQLKSMIGCRM